MKAVATTNALALYVARELLLIFKKNYASRMLSALTVAAAQATLYIPGFDPQAITADVEGVAADGHTTWRIGPGVTSGTYEDPPGILHSGEHFVDSFSGYPLTPSFPKPRSSRAPRMRPWCTTTLPSAYPSLRIAASITASPSAPSSRPSRVLLFRVPL